MKKWPTSMFTCIFASLLCMLSGDLYAAGLMNCGGKEMTGASPALRRSMQHACERSRVAVSCTATADKRKMTPREREAFIAQCEGLPKPTEKKNRR